MTPKVLTMRHRSSGLISILNSHKKKESALFIPLVILTLISCLALLYLLIG
jgi:hypothetical protein